MASSLERRRVALGLLGLSLAPACRRGPGPTSLLVAGSGSLHAYLEPLAAAFAKKLEHTHVVNEAGGTTAAVLALKRGAIDVAAMGRDLTPEEDDLATRNYLVARDGLAIVAHASNPVTDIPAASVTAVFDGSVTTWKALGGGEGAIHPIVRDRFDPEKHRKSVTRKSFDDVVMAGDEPTGEARSVPSAAAMIEAVERDPLALGFLALRDLAPAVKALTVGGVAMSRLTLLSDRYPLARSYYLTVCRPSKLAEDFVAFAVGAAGQEILAQQGLVPVF